MTCHTCEYRHAHCSGPCPCTVDGLDIIEHAERGFCPKGRFSDAAPMPSPSPITTLNADEQSLVDDLMGGKLGLGDQVHAIAKRIGAERVARLWESITGHSCGCDARRKALNERFPGGWRQLLGQQSP